MNCDAAREQIGGDPDTVSAELQEHLNSCPACATYRDEMLAFNAKLRRAMDLNFPAARTLTVPGGADAAVGVAARSNVIPLTPRLQQRAPRKRPRGVAVAVSIAAAVLAAFALWLSRPSDSLAAEIVTHVEGEPDSWSRTQAVPVAALDAVLLKSGVKLGSGMQPVVYASSCWFRGHFVPHFVITTREGPVTVMILMNEHVGAVQQFKEDGYSGLLVPAATGSVAVLSRTPMALSVPAASVVRALTAAND